MDVEEARRAVYTRVQCFDSANVLKIMGYLLLQEIGEKEMLQLAVSSDSVVQAFVSKAKMELGLISKDEAIDGGGSNLDDDQMPVPIDANSKLCGEEQAMLQSPGRRSHPAPVDSIEERPSYLEKLTKGDHVNHTVNDTSSPSPPGSTAWKPCLYFARGYCKHGSGCRFLHSFSDESLEKIGGGISVNSSSSSSSSTSSCSNLCGAAATAADLGSDSLAGLEGELRELLSVRKAPVSIASLPQLYQEKFGKPLQADGYLTESQRHGKAGHSLTKLLVKLRATVTLIDRPHGQHAIVLTEDAHKFMPCSSSSSNNNNISNKGDGDESTMNSSSRQIYLTFPAESVFSEEDVTTHFSNYGPVQDVRIPYQQKRMFGFVTFTYSETVRTILAEGNPHYICGARVLVKPYKEKGKISTEKRVQQGRSFDRNRHQQSTALKYHLQDRLLSEEDLAVALRQKLAELHFASVQKRMAETYLAAGGSSVAPALLPELENTFVNTAQEQDLSQVQLNPYSYVLDVLDLDPNGGGEEASKDHTLKCNLQSDDKKFTAMPADAPTFFAHDIF